MLKHNNWVVRLAVLSLLLLRPMDALASGCPGSGNQSSGPDVIVGDLTGPANYAAVGTLEALSLGTTSCNLGDAQLLWNVCPQNTHPVIGGNLYRWSTVNGATRFEQIGQSWLKHAFTALQGSTCCSNCQPSGTGTRLGIGCSDPYTADRNGIQSGLGPKYTVNAHTGAYPTGCPTHPSGGNTGRLEVDVADLVATSGGPAATTRYFGQSQYVSPDDAASHNQNNNGSYREVTVSGSGTAWTFGFLGSTVREVPAIRHWKEIDTGIVETDVDTPEDDGFPGRVILCTKVTNLGAGFWRYEYAVNNLNSDRSIGSYTVPVSGYATVQNIGFHDVAYRGGDGIGGVNFDGTDWPGAFAGGAVSWSTTPFATNNNANAIRWGALYNFRFDANLPPISERVTLGEFKVVTPISALSIVPELVTCTKGDINGDGVIDGLDVIRFTQILVNGNAAATPREKCAGDLEAGIDYQIDPDDIDNFANCLLAGGGC